VAPDGLAALAGEVERGGVEEDQVELGEQVPVAREERLLDLVCRISPM